MKHEQILESGDPATQEKTASEGEAEVLHYMHSLWTYNIYDVVKRLQHMSVSVAKCTIHNW